MSIPANQRCEIAGQDAEALLFVYVLLRTCACYYTSFCKFSENIRFELHFFVYGTGQNALYTWLRLDCEKKRSTPCSGEVVKTTILRWA
jgi:hypothetical protein